MVRSKLGLKALGLSALMLGLMAWLVGAAQAETNARWMVNGTNIENTSTLEPLLAATIENKDAGLLTTILGIKTKILCEVGELKNVHLIKEGGLTNGGKVRFSGCETYLTKKLEGGLEHEELSKACLPKTAGVNDVIETNAGVGLLSLVGSAGETKIKSSSGGALAVVESSEECAVGQKINITGELIIKDCENKIKEELVTHLIEADNVNSTLKASGQPATIDGSATVVLEAGNHTGLKWSGLPA